MAEIVATGSARWRPAFHLLENRASSRGSARASTQFVGERFQIAVAHCGRIEDPSSWLLSNRPEEFHLRALPESSHDRADTSLK
jgi:hypothetical protein